MSSDPARPALLLDSGNQLFRSSRIEPADLEAARLAADTVIRAARSMGGSLSGLGSLDLAAGVGFLRPFHQPPAFAWAALNLVDPANGKPLFAPVIRRQVGGLTVAVLGLVDHTALKPSASEYALQSWQSCLPAALAALKGKVDLIVLLSNYSLAENQNIAWKHSEIDLILQSGHAIGNQAPILANQTLIAQTEVRGKYLGILDIDWHGHGRWSEMPNAPRDRKPLTAYSNRFLPLTPSLPVDTEVARLVRDNQWKIEQIKARQQNR